MLKRDRNNENADTFKKIAVIFQFKYSKWCYGGAAATLCDKVEGFFNI